MEIRLGLRWWVADRAAEELPEALIQLLEGIARGGNLRYAAQEAQLSYRHAWGLLKHWEQRFGVPLVALEQGRGADLTRAGERLRELWQKTRERTAAALAEAAAQASQQLAHIAVEPAHERMVIAGSHGYGLSAMVSLLRKAKVEPEVRLLGSEEALKAYAAGECDAAGFHLPVGRYGKPLWTRYLPLMQARRDIALLIETRELGFMTRDRGEIRSPRDIAARGLRFLNRQGGSGSRLLFDLLLTEEGLAPSDIPGYEDEEYTHSAVAATIASARAEVGFGARAAAVRFGLRFTPVVTEKYLLVVSRESLRRRPLSLIERVLASQAYKRLLNETPGSDSRGSGRQMELRHLPTLFLKRRTTRPRSTAGA